MIDMVKKLYLPVAAKYGRDLAAGIIAKKSAGGADDSYETDLLQKVSSLTGKIYKQLSALESAVDGVSKLSSAGEIALYYRNEVFSRMNELRASVDELEGYVPSSEWPVPSYGDLLFSVK